MIGVFACFLWMILSWFEYSIDLSSPFRDLLKIESFSIVFWVITSGSLIFTFIVIVLIIKEFNELLSLKVKQATAQLRANNEKLRETLRFERDMSDILGHELRTPLSIARNAIFLTNKYLNLEEPDLLKAKNYCSTALKNTQKEVELLNTLLTSTKIDNNKLEIHLSEVNIADIIKNSIYEFENKAKKKGLNLIRRIPNKCFVETDKARFQEITDNLIENAIKYTDKGFVEIKLKILKTNILFIVKDSGKGIPKKHIKNLGKKFYRVDNYIKKESNSNSQIDIVRPGGTGLGLYVTFSLIKALQGSIKIKSDEGKGSIFKVSIPKNMHLAGVGPTTFTSAK